MQSGGAETRRNNGDNYNARHCDGLPRFFGEKQPALGEVERERGNLYQVRAVLNRKEFLAEAQRRRGTIYNARHCEDEGRSNLLQASAVLNRKEFLAEAQSRGETAVPSTTHVIANSNGTEAILLN